VKFYYDYIEDYDIDFEEVVSPCSKKKPQWWKDMSFYLRGFNTVKDYWSSLTQQQKLQAEAFTTVKACPGFRDLFANAYLIKFPCDILVETTADGGFTWKVPSSQEILKLVSHNSEQMVSHIDKFVFKFELPFLMAGDAQLIFMDPTYYKEQPYQVCPGVVKLHSNTRGLGLNVLTFFDKRDATYHFKKDEPMAMLYFPTSCKVRHRPLQKFVKKQFILEYGKKYSGVLE